ncbi:MAG TPA: cupin domain-containing protein [Candidatus Saccharimonadales bacterium]|nr:cupin domain-containing protein [Candidatus Saccharimonadales bacterium]
MANYKKINLKEDTEDAAVKFGYAPNMESRFGRSLLESEKSGASYFKIAPSFKVPFGHKHKEQEETYVLISGSAKMKLGEEILELKPFDAVRVSPGMPRGIAAGSKGAEIIAFGAGQSGDAEMLSDFWKE